MDDPTASVRSVERLEALRGAGLLDTPPEASFDRLTRLATALVRAPVALVSLVDAHRQFFKSQVGLPEPWASMRETPLTHSFCQYVVSTERPLVVQDARVHPVLKDNLAIPDLGVIAYAGMPLATRDGQVLGSFCAIHSEPHDWTEEELATLNELAEMAISEMELRRLGRELAARNEELRQLNDQKDQLLGMAAHDLRNPLSAVLGYSTFLSAAGLDPRLARFAENTRASASYMLSLVESLLDVSRIEAGRLDLRLAAADFVDLARRRVELNEILAERKGIALRFQWDGAALPVLVDVVKMEQVIENLLGNALKFSPSDTTVTVRAWREGDQAVLEVCDQGPGIPAEEQSRLFQPFGRTSVRPTGGEKSTGLGLSIARRIVEGHGGRIEVSSECGVGSTFRVRVPLNG